MCLRPGIFELTTFSKVVSLDTEVYASGFTRDMDQDLQKEVCFFDMLLVVHVYH